MNIPANSIEIDRIYSLLSSQGVRSVAIASANSGEGVSSIALALAHRSLLAGHSTLLVDLNLYHPSFKHVLNLNEATPESTLLSRPELLSQEHSSIVVTGVSAPIQREVAVKLRQPGELEQCIEHWLTSFERIIIDTSPINRVNANNIPPELVAASCDGCIFVVLAGHTTESMVVSATDKLNNASVNVLGSVINDKNNPILKNELIRETRRLRPRFEKLANQLEKWLHNNRLLSLDV